MSFFHDDRPAAVLITQAQQSRQEELRSRTRRYALTMTVRTLAFIVAVILPVPVGAKIALIGAAIILPWLAVMAANAGPVRDDSRASYDVGAGSSLTEPLRIEGGHVIDAEV